SGTPVFGVAAPLVVVVVGATVVVVVGALVVVVVGATVVVVVGALVVVVVGATVVVVVVGEVDALNSASMLPSAAEPPRCPRPKESSMERRIPTVSTAAVYCWGPALSASDTTMVGTCPP